MKHWYNNGEIVKYCEECPDGFKPGRINKKPTEIEQRNARLVEKITAEFSAENFIKFYTEHTTKEILTYFNIPNEKIVYKILKYFNYDFSKSKPSHFKGKASTRSHESYISGGKKSSETQKQNWDKKNQDEIRTWKNKMSDSHKTEHYKMVKTNANRQIWFARSEEERQRINKKRSETMKVYAENLSEEDFPNWCDKRSYKKYAIDDIYFDSFPELTFYLYNKEELHNGIIRPKRRIEYEFDREKHFYLPDFEVNGDLVEIKGDQLYEQMLIPNTLDSAKYACMKTNNVKIIRTSEYIQYENWFIAKGYKKEDFLYK